MNPQRILILCLLLTVSSVSAETRVLFFAKENAKEYTRVALSIEDNEKVYGTKVWQPMGEHGARGTFEGIVNGDVIQVVYDYTIEGAEQSEEMVFKLEGDTLLIGEGELEEAGNGRLNLKEPNKVSFTTALKKVTVSEPKQGTPERKAIMDAMREPVSEFAGKPVIFTGKIRAMGSWARFFGSVSPADGKKSANESVAADMELDFTAFLKKDAEGNWTVLNWGFAGDTSVTEEAKENHPKAPWPLFEWVQ